jgi:hypothetical protein
MSAIDSTIQRSRARANLVGSGREEQNMLIMNAITNPDDISSNTANEEASDTPR